MNFGRVSRNVHPLRVLRNVCSWSRAATRIIARRYPGVTGVKGPRRAIRPLVTLRRILLMPIRSGYEGYFTGVVTEPPRAGPQRRREKSNGFEDARIKYDGINIGDACSGERVQLETREKKPVGKNGKKRKGRGVREMKREGGGEESERGEYLKVVTHVAMELSATN